MRQTRSLAVFILSLLVAGEMAVLGQSIEHNHYRRSMLDVSVDQPATGVAATDVVTTLPRMDDSMITDKGLRGEKSGWFDAQCQGATNDFCRYKTDGGYWTCALAGSTLEFTPKGLYMEKTTSVQPCTKCSPGHGGPTCAECRANTYSLGGTSSNWRAPCKPCPRGQVTLGAGASVCTNASQVADALSSFVKIQEEVSNGEVEVSAFRPPWTWPSRPRPQAAAALVSTASLAVKIQEEVSNGEVELELAVAAALTAENIAKFASLIAAGKSKVVVEQLKALPWANWTVGSCSEDETAACVVEPDSAAGRRLFAAFNASSSDLVAQAKAGDDYFKEMWDNGLTPGRQLLESDFGRELLFTDHCVTRVISSSLDSVFLLFSLVGFRARLNWSRVASKFDRNKIHMLRAAAEKISTAGDIWGIAWGYFELVYKVFESVANPWVFLDAIDGMWWWDWLWFCTSLLLTFAGMVATGGWSLVVQVVATAYGAWQLAESWKETRSACGW